MLSDRPGSASLRFFYSSLFWLIVPGLIGLFLATFLYTPAFYDHLPLFIKPYLSFGRMRPAHVNLAIFGWLSQAYAGAILYIVPRLTRTRLYSERLAHVNWWLWNLMNLGALITLPLGLTQGREYAEMIWPLDVLFITNIVLLAINIWVPVLRRKEPKIYVSLWNFMAATLVVIPIYIVGNKMWDYSGAYTGMTDSIVNYFYVHNLFNSWFTTAGLGLAFYLLPKLTGKPLYSHRLALWGLWSVWTGEHHELYSPAPNWLQTLTIVFSILAIVPTTAFLVNFFMTMRGSWSKLRDDVPLRFLAVGAIFWGLTCVQGVSQSFRSFSLIVHLTNWVVGHSHLAFVADYTFWAFALIYLMQPALLRRPAMYSKKLMEWHFWLVFVGIVLFMVSLWIAGLIQGFDWLNTNIPFITTVTAMSPFFLGRLVGGVLVGLGVLVFVYNVWMTSRLPAVVPVPTLPVAAATGGAGAVPSQGTQA